MVHNSAGVEGRNKTIDSSVAAWFQLGTDGPGLVCSVPGVSLTLAFQLLSLDARECRAERPGSAREICRVHYHPPPHDAIALSVVVAIFCGSIAAFTVSSSNSVRSPWM